MPLHDLNKPPDEGQEVIVPDLNEKHPDEEVGGAPTNQVEGQGVVLQEVNPLDLNFAPVEEDEQPAITFQHEHGEGNQDGFPFDLNFDAVDEEDHLHTDYEEGMEAHLQQEIEDIQEEFQEYSVYADAVDIEFDQEELPDSDDEHDAHENGNEAKRYKNVTDAQRQQIYEALLAASEQGKLGNDCTTIVSNQLNIKLRTVQRVWQRAKECLDQRVTVDVSSRKPKCSGRKKIQVDLSRVLTIPLHDRSTIRKLAKELKINKSSVHRWFKDGLLRRHSNSLKPYLKEDNKKQRLKWCISMLDQQTLPNEPKFIEMDNIIHIDEKWFNATQKVKKYYMLPGEDDPHRTVQTKNAIQKVMFLSAVAKPKRDAAGHCIFDGKIGIWPLIKREPAKRRSRNRDKGTLVTKNIKVDRDTMRSYLISKLLPAIQACWPREQRQRTIWIQQDNAPSHVPVNDPQFALAAAQTGLDIRLMNQPPNSPDMNCLDLGFFASLQSFTYNTVSRNMDELIDNVKKEYEQYNPILLTRVFLTLQSCMIEVMKANGGNKYKIPHMNKARLEALGILPNTLSCDRQVYESALESLGI